MRRWIDILQGRIWKYLLFAAVAILFWSAVFSSLDQIKDHECVTISVYNLACDWQAMREELLRRAPELTDQPLKTVYVDALTLVPNQAYSDANLDMQLTQADLIIMPQSLLRELEVERFFPVISEGIRDLLGYERQYYAVDGFKYGIAVDLKSTGLLPEAMDTQESSYILLSPYSVNLGGLLGRGKAEHDAALKIMLYLLEGGET